MAVTHDSNITVTVRLAAPAITPAGFSRVAVLVDVTGQLATNPTVFTTTTAVDEDTDLSADQKKIVKQVLSQLQPAEDVLVASYDSLLSETPVDAYNLLVDGNEDFYAVISDTRDAAEQIALSEEIQTKGNAGDKASFYVMQSADSAWLASGALDSGGAFEELADNNRTLVIYHDPPVEDGADGALAGYRFSFDQDQRTPQIRGQLQGTVADLLTATEKSAADSNNVTTVLPYGNIPAFASPGKVASGEVATDIITADWLSARLFERIQTLDANAVARGEAIPLNPTGQALLSAELADVFEDGIAASKLESFDIPEPYPTITTSDVSNLRLPLAGTAVPLRGSVEYNFEVDLAPA